MISEDTILDSFSPIDGKSFISLHFTDPQWLIDSYIPSNGLTMLAATSGSWKTWVTLLITKAITTGTKFLDKYQALQGSVLLINEEDVPRNFQERMKMLDISGENLQIMSRKGFKISDPFMFKRIQEIKKEHNIKLIIIDHLALVQESEENSSQENTKDWQALRSLTIDGCSILTVHHFRKRDQRFKSSSVDITLQKEMVRGSSAHVANQDSLISIEPLQDEADGTSAFVLSQPKCRDAKAQEPLKILVKIVDHISALFTSAGKYDSTITAVEKAMSSILEAMFKEDRFFLVDELTKMGFGSDKTVRLAISALRKRGELIEKKAKELDLSTDSRVKAYRINNEEKVVEQELIF